MKKEDSSLIKENQFDEFCNIYIPQINYSIVEFFKNKKTNADFQFIRDLYSDLEEYCLRKGKRLRPIILLISYFGYNKKSNNLKDIVRIASVLEIMHAFLLIQDDIIDRSKIRRGKKALHFITQHRYANITNNRNIGRDVALILGDVLFANAIEIIGEVKANFKIKDEFLKLFAKTYELTAWGQILDSINSLPKEIDINNPAPIQISTLKTAYYTIMSPMVMGFILSGNNNDKEEKRIRDFSLPLGLAFQIRDDILGIFSSKDKTGKTSDSDIMEGKLTLLVQNTVKKMDKEHKEEFLSIFNKRDKSKEEIKKIREMIENSNALDISKIKLKEQIDKSRKHLEKLNININGKLILSDLLDMIIKI